MTDAKTTIDEAVKSSDVVLFMKGTKSMPQCGFSSRVAGVLTYMGVDFADVNVLADDGIRRVSRNIPTGRRSRSFTSRASSSADATSSPK